MQKTHTHTHTHTSIRDQVRMRAAPASIQEPTWTNSLINEGETERARSPFLVRRKERSDARITATAASDDDEEETKANDGGGGVGGVEAFVVGRRVV